MDSDDIPELLVYYQYNAPPAPDYYVIYHYVAATKEHEDMIDVYYSDCVGWGGSESPWNYLPHGGAFYTSSRHLRAGSFDYNLFVLKNDKWMCWKELPVVLSRLLAENYGVFDAEAIRIDFNINMIEPMFSDKWRTPELSEIWTAQAYDNGLHFDDIEDMFGSDAVAGLPHDTD